VGSEPSDGPDFDPIPEALSSDEDVAVIELQGGETYADILAAIGAPPPWFPMVLLQVPPRQPPWCRALWPMLHLCLLLREARSSPSLPLLSSSFIWVFSTSLSRGPKGSVLSFVCL
jgi:hypothetical protein